MKTIVIILLLTITVSTAQTWEKATAVGDVAECVVFNPLNPRTIFVGTADTILLRSYDGGDTWDTLNPALGRRKQHALAISPLDTNLIIMFHEGGSDTSFRSTNQGKDWVPMILPKLAGATITTYRVNSESVMFDSENPSIVYAALNINARATPIPIPTQPWFCRSTDAGATWDTLANFRALFPGVYFICGMTTNAAGHIFVGGYSGAIMRSKDKGKTWDLVNKPRLSNSGGKTPGIKFSRAYPNLGFATNLVDVQGGAGILRTDDGGETWKNAVYADTSFWGLELVDRQDGKVEVVAGINGLNSPFLVHSLDQGFAWSRIDDASTPWRTKGDNERYRTYSIKYNPAHPRGRQYYFATGSGLLMYSPFGVSVEEEEKKRLQGEGISFITLQRQVQESSQLQSLTFYNACGSVVAHIADNFERSLYELSSTLGNGMYIATLKSADGKIEYKRVMKW